MGLLEARVPCVSALVLQKGCVHNLHPGCCVFAHLLLRSNAVMDCGIQHSSSESLPSDQKLLFLAASLHLPTLLTFMTFSWASLGVFLHLNIIRTLPLRSFCQHVLGIKLGDETILPGLHSAWQLLFGGLHIQNRDGTSIFMTFPRDHIRFSLIVHDGKASHSPLRMSEKERVEVIFLAPTH